MGRTPPPAQCLLSGAQDQGSRCSLIFGKWRVLWVFDETLSDKAQGRQGELWMVTSLRLHDASPLRSPTASSSKSRQTVRIKLAVPTFIRTWEAAAAAPPSGRLGAARSCLRALGGVVLLHTMRRFALCLPHGARRRDRQSRIIVEIVRVQLSQNRITIAFDEGGGDNLAAGILHWHNPVAVVARYPA